MKVLMVSQFYHPHIGGKENWCRQVSERLVKRGFQITILTSSYDSRSRTEVYNGVKIIRQPLLHLFRVYAAPLVIPTFLLEHYDLMHFIEPSSISLFPYLICRAKHIPHIVNFHNEPIGGKLLSFRGKEVPIMLYKKQLHCMFLTCEKIITYEVVKRSKLLDGLGYKVIIMNSGLDFNTFSSNVTHYSDNANAILFVGRLVFNKGIETLFEALKKLNRNVKLTVVGGEPPKIEKYRHLAQKLGIASLINFVGWSPYQDMPYYYNNSDFLVLPSIATDSFGQVCLESLSCGKPVIVSDMVGFSTIVKKERVGLVVPPKNSQALAEAIQYLLDHPKIRRRMGEKGRRIVRKFDYNRVADKIEYIYMDVFTKYATQSKLFDT